MKKRILSILLVLTMIVGMFPIWILTANATDDADLSKAQLKNGGNVEITEASVNGKATANNETVKLTTANDSAAVKFAWNGLSREAVAAGYKLVPSIRYYFEGRLAPVDYTPVNNSVTFNTGVAYEGQWMSYILDLVLVKPDGTQETVDSHTIYMEVENINISTANISLPTPIESMTPANAKGSVKTTGVKIVSETWYEFRGSSLRAMSESEEFIAGRQYKYEVFVASEKGYRLASDFALKINDSFVSGNGGFWKSRSFVARTVLSAQAVNNTLVVEHGGKVNLAVTARGEGLEYLWRNTCGQVGAPSIGVNGHDNITLTCANAGNFTYTCTVSDKYGNAKTVEFMVMVKAKVQTPKDIYIPAMPKKIGSGLDGIADVENIAVIKGSSITLKATFNLDMDPDSVWNNGKTPLSGEMSYEWVLLSSVTYGTVKTIGTGDSVTLDANIHDTFNTNYDGSIFIWLNVTNSVEIGGELLSQSFPLYIFEVKLVEREATGDVAGKIGADRATKALSTRFSDSLEGTTVYLVKENAVVYATDCDANGNYLFTGVPYGTYTIKVDKEGYDEYNEPLDVSQAEVTHDITILLHECFSEENGMLWCFPAKEAECSDVTDGVLGNVEYYSCQNCGKFYDAERNLIADSVADPNSLNDMGVPYKALIYPMHQYYGVTEGGDIAETYLRHRADTCLEETTYWYYCINPSCRKSAGDDLSAVDMYYVAGESNQAHSYTLEIAEEYYRYDFHELGENGKENCKQNIWYYHACKYCYEKGNTVWESDLCGEHSYGPLTESNTHVCTVCGYETEPGASDHVCSGGYATCISPANCSTCGEPYGEPNPENHDLYGYPKAEADSKYHTHHDTTCDLCKVIVYEEEHYFGPLTERNTRYCIVCWYETEPVVQSIDTNIKFNHTLNLASDISANFAIAKSLLSGYDMATAYVEFEIDTYSGNEKTGTETTQVTGVLNGSYYYFTFTGLNATMMNNEIRATFYGTKDGAYYKSNADTYSVATYAYSQMNKPEAKKSLKTLCADLLRYGATAQIYKKYRTDALANAAMTDAHKSYLSDDSAVAFDNYNRENCTIPAVMIPWVGKILILDSKVALRYVVDLSNYTGDVEDLKLVVKYTGIDGTAKTETLTELRVYNEAKNQYYFELDSLLAAELRQELIATVYSENTPMGSDLHYSVSTYGNNKTGTLLTLCKHLMAYSDSAKAYFAG